MLAAPCATLTCYGHQTWQPHCSPDEVVCCLQAKLARVFAISEAAWERYDPLSLQFELLQRIVSDWRQQAQDRAEDAREVQREGAALQYRY